jgi:hypothetical protein
MDQTKVNLGMMAARYLLLTATVHAVRGESSWPPCSGPVPSGANVTDVHLVMMNHLDVGFGEQNGTQEGYINNVLNEYFQVYFPRAVRVAEELRSRNGPERLVYTTHGWLAHLYVHCVAFVLSGVALQCPSAEDRAAFIVAVRRGDLVWQAGAFNSECVVSLSLSLSLSFSIDDSSQHPRDLACTVGRCRVPMQH